VSGGRPAGPGLCCDVPTRRTGRSISVDQLAYGGDLATELGPGRRLAVDLVAGGEDRGVVSAAELGTDPQERHVRLLAHEVHRDLAGYDDRPVTFLALEGVPRDTVIVRHHPGDPLGGDLT